MSKEHSNPPAENGLVIRPSTDLVRLPDGASSALSEIIGRSLVHIQTSKALGMLHRIGEHELYGPDYRLVCAWAEELRKTPEEVLARVLRDYWLAEVPVGWTPDFECRTKLVRGRFKSIHVDCPSLRVGGFPSIEGLVLEKLAFFGGQDGTFKLDLSVVPKLKALACKHFQLTELDLSAVPMLTKLYCYDNQLTELDLSAVPDLTELDCENNQLVELDLSAVPKLTKLFCRNNQLTELDLSGVPNLKALSCGHLKLAELDLSSIPNLTELCCQLNPLAELDLSSVPNLTELSNQLVELDVSMLSNLTKLEFDSHSTRLIQRPDQNFE